MWWALNKLYYIIYLCKRDRGGTIKFTLCTLHPALSPAWAYFSIIMECTPESGRCHSVFYVAQPLVPLDCPAEIRTGDQTCGSIFIEQLFQSFIKE